MNIIVVRCLSLWFFTTVYAQNPRVTITEPYLPVGVNTLNVQAGSMVDFACVVRNKPENRYVKWLTYTKGVNSTTQLISKDVETTDTRYTVLKPDSITWKLRIKNVQQSMNGPYVCLVSLTTHSETKDVIFLTVIKRPRINNILTSKDQTLTEFEPMTLFCDADGIPPPVIKWTRLALADLPQGGKELRKKKLEIPSLRAEHRGKYICQADNIGGQARRIISVIVKFRPVVTPSHNEVYQKVGYAKMLMCDIKAYPPPTKAQISWTKAGESEALDDNFIERTSLGANDRVTTRLYIKRTRMEDYGEYVCSASNDHGTRKAAITFSQDDEISVEPSIYTYGSSTKTTSSVLFILLVFIAVLSILN